MSTFVHVKGLDELQKFLDQLPGAMQRSVLRGAMRDGAKVILNEAKARVPVGKTGNLRDSLHISADARKGVVTAKISTSGCLPANLPLWVEYGTAAHLIKVQDEERPTRMTRHGPVKFSMKAINGMISRGSLVVGGHFIGPVVAHPGAQPKPFMRPALDAKAHEALIAIGEGIKKRLTKRGLDASGVDLSR